MFFSYGSDKALSAESLKEHSTLTKGKTSTTIQLKELGLTHKKHTTDDMLFTVETVSCLGACGLAPTLTVNDEVHPKMTPEKAVELLNELRGESV